MEVRIQLQFYKALIVAASSFTILASDYGEDVKDFG